MQLILTGLLFWFIGWLIEPKNKKIKFISL